MTVVPLPVLPLLDAGVPQPLAALFAARAGNDDLAPWLAQVARVRPGAAALANAAQLAELVAGGPLLDFAAAQLPDTPHSPWAASGTRGHRAVDCVVLGHRPAAERAGAGFVVEAWTEVVPETHAVSGIAVHFDRPSAAAPNAVLLAVTRTGDAFSLDYVRLCVSNALRMAQFRALGADAGHPFGGQFLPATLLSGDTAWRDELAAPRGSVAGPELSEGLEARIADPLWTLARQWQVGEFHGEDAASPVLVSAEVEWATLSGFAPGPSGSPAPALPREQADRPLEVLAEEEAADDDVRLTLDAGWALLRALQRARVASAVLNRLRTRYRVALAPDDGRDPPGRAELELVASRSFDGLRLARELTPIAGRPQLLHALGLTPVEPLVTRWLSQANELVRTPTATTPPSWQDRSLEYRFRVAAGSGADEETLEASEYRGRSTGTTSRAPPKRSGSARARRSSGAG